MIIRKAINSDFDSIANLHIESWKNSYSDVLPSEFLESKIIPSLKDHWRNIKISDNDVVLIAEQREIIGFIAVWCRPTPFIDNLHVKPSLRSHNVGTTLMKVAAEELIKKGNTIGYLWVFNNNETAIKFYEKLGGIQKELEIKDIFGHKVLNRKIEWADLSVILWTPEAR